MIDLSNYLVGTSGEIVFIRNNFFVEVFLSTFDAFVTKRSCKRKRFIFACFYRMSTEDKEQIENDTSG